MINSNDQSGTEPNIEASKKSGMYLVLSLFILLLSFFILINGISTRTEVKSSAVMDSVLSTFSVTDSSSNYPSMLVSKPDTIGEPEQFINDMRRVWIAELPFTKIKFITNGRLMRFVVPIHSIFYSDSSLIRKDRKQLINQISEVLATESVGFKNEVEILIGNKWQIGEKPNFGTDNLEIIRAIRFVKELERGGAPRDSISIGIREGSEEEMEFRFFGRSRETNGIEFK